MKPPWKTVFVVCLIAMQMLPTPVAAQGQLTSFADEGHRLAALLRVGRNVVSKNQSLINDEALGNKGLNSNVFMTDVIDQYKSLYGMGPLDGSLTEMQERLTQAQLQAMAEILDENQDLINTKGMGFKGFIPAVFARLVNERFDAKLGNLAKVKVTAPLDLVRNRKARPDEWEAAVLNDKFRSKDWPKGEAFFDEVTSDGTSTFRMLIPEYYGASCLSCHGEPKGDVDVTGFPKEGGREGDLAGAISITLQK